MRTIFCLVRKIATRLAVLSVVSVITPCVSFGQSAAPSVASSMQQGSGTVTDIFVGKGTRGPYTLNWKQIDADSEVILVNGATLRKNTDYNIDYASGMVGFSQALTNGTIARVTYRYTAGKAVQNTGGVTVPLNLTLMQKTGRSLGLTGMIKQGDGTAANPGMSVFGLNAATDVGSVSKLTSTFMMSATDDSKAGQDKGDFWDRSAVNLGDQLTLGKLQVKTSFIRTGEKFAGAKDYNLAGGQQAMDMAASFNPTTAIAASMSIKRQDDIGGQDKGTINNLLEQRVVFSFPKSPKMTLTRTLNEKDARGNNPAERNEVSKILLEQNIGKKASASAFVETADTQKGTTGDEVRTSQLNFNAAPNSRTNFASQYTIKDSQQQGESDALSFNLNSVLSSKLNVASSYVLNDSDKAGGSSNFGLNINATPNKMVRTAIGYTQFKSDQQGDTTGLNFKMDANPDKNVQVAMAYNEVDSDKQGKNATTNVAINANAAPGVKVQTNYDVKSVEKQGDTTTAGVKVAANLIGNKVSLNTSAVNVDSTNAVGQQSRDVAIETKPIDAMKISVGVGRKETGDQGDDSRNARVEVSPFTHTTLGAGYKYSENGATNSTIRDFSARTRPVSFMEFNVTYKTRDVTGVDPLDTMALQWKLDPFKWFKLNGQYARNPEDMNTGNVQRFDTRTFGAETSIGIMCLSGGYTSKDEYVAGKETRETQLGMSLRLFGNGKLTTGYKVAELEQAVQTATITYSLGYSHSIGSDFNLSLSGQMTQYQKEQVMLDDQTEYQADFKLGLTF